MGKLRVVTMADIQADTVIRRVETPGSRIQDEIVFFDREAGKYYASGPVGADIWDFIETPRSFFDICEYLISSYAVDRNTCESEALTFLQQMLAAGLVVAEASAPKA